MGAAKTAAWCSSASLIKRSTAPSRATPAPVTMAGLFALAESAESFVSSVGSGPIDWLTERVVTQSVSLSQSSAGIDKNTGPRGACIAM